MASEQSRLKPTRGGAGQFWWEDSQRLVEWRKELPIPEKELREHLENLRRGASTWTTELLQNSIRRKFELPVRVTSSEPIYQGERDYFLIEPKSE